MSSHNQALLSEISKISFGILNITAKDFASYVEKFVHFGSKRYILSKESLTVYSVPSRNFENKDKVTTTTIDGDEVPDTLEGHLINGTKFLDAILFMHLPDDEKPTTTAHDEPKKTSDDYEFDTFDDYTLIAKYMFFCYFYILTRARAPEQQNGGNVQPVPKFLSLVLSISASPGEIAEYLASFDINHMDPSWVKEIKLEGLGQEALSRFGLGVAGYRQAAPFKLREPDGPDAKKYASAIAVARSFATQPACWDFHPSTRHPNVLQKYGNLNKNLGNLMLKVYARETLDIMVKARIIYEIPIEDPTHTNFTTWNEQLIYSTSAAIFPSI